MFLLAAKCEQASAVRAQRLAIANRQPTSLVSFKTSLKTFLYRKVFINSSVQVNRFLYFCAHIYIYSYIFKMFFYDPCAVFICFFLLFLIGVAISSVFLFPSVKPFVTFSRKELYKSLLLLLLPLLKCK